ncbi:hypothetical protein PV08_11699 [Exophiala spinifera]|uniref:BZIP domain-containing protein n=1 Tax=Exophiala spinifera TaxID=91928 RepID=A0A0D2AT81_9EURO|nr:uncharacterized protein PV08_11699 [Exophiala spinifera]KIW09923.1 hypothetical protein PV08_11699 [Exophiala spinifera]
MSRSRTTKSKLTDAQLQRKRECDREAQKQIRLKTKTRIAHLENLVATLQQSDGTRSQVSDLVRQVTKGHEEITRLREALRAIGKQVEGSLRSSSRDSTQLVGEDPGSRPYTSNDEEVFPDFVDSLEQQKSTDGSPTNTDDPSQPEDAQREGCKSARINNTTAHAESINAHVDSTDTLELSIVNMVAGTDESITSLHLDLSTPEMPLDTLTSAESSLASLPISEMAAQITQDKSLDGRLWYLAGTLLNLILAVEDKERTPDEYNDDIPIRAVLHGWPAVAARYTLDLGWQWIRQLDEKMYSSLGVPERLSVMRLMRIQYQVQAHPDTMSSVTVPSFMVPRPAQAHIQHDPLIEHWVWPGLREQLLFNPFMCATNRFMDNFRESLHFLWPFDPTDAYCRNSLTGMYSFSTMFLDRSSDLRSHCLSKKFLDLFPQLKPDIPSFDVSLWNQNLLLTTTLDSAISWQSKPLTPEEDSDDLLPLELYLDSHK